MTPKPDTCRFCRSSSIGSSTCPTCQEKLFALAFEDDADDRIELVDVAAAADYNSAGDSGFDRFGHYQILSRADGSLWELGRGSMGVTYKAFDTALQCCVALKLINTQALLGQEANDRFLREARAAAQLRHPNIAAVHHLGSRNGTWFYSMEFIEGETLHDFVGRTGPPPWRQALRIVTQVARALVQAHTQGFIHRDIKPSNVMLTKGSDGLIAKLIDFGLVKGARFTADDAAIERAYFIGTPQFASPEQINSGEADARSDIYSLGATFYFMLTGRSPSTANRTVLTNLRRDFPGAVVALLNAAISPERNRRPASAEDFLTRCERCQKLSRLQEIGTSARKYLRAVGLIVIVWLIGVALFPGTSFHREEEVKLKTPSDMARSQNIEAYTAQVRASELSVKITEEDNRRAIELYEKAVRLDPNYTQAHAGLAQSYCLATQMGWLPQSRKLDALLSAQRALALSPDAAEAHFALGLVYSTQGLQAKSMGEMHRALELNPTFEPAMRSYGWAWLEMGKPEKALPWLEAAMLREPDSVNGRVTIAECYKDLCVDDLAENNFRQALAIAPAGLGARYGLTHLEILRGNFDLAEDLCAKGLALRPDDLFGLTLAAQIALFRGDLSKAEQLYRSILPRVQNGDFLVFYGSIRCESALAYILSRTGRIVEAEQFAREAEKLDRDAAADSHQSWFDLSAVQATRGDLNAAVDSFDEAVKRGWIDYRAAFVDPRFEELRALPAFQQVISRLRESISKARVNAIEYVNRPLRLSESPLPVG